MSEARKFATYDDILALPSEMTGEIISGELHVNPRPHARHQNAMSKLFLQIGIQYSSGRVGGNLPPSDEWIILTETELFIQDHVLVPDLVGWRKSQLPMSEAEFFSEASIKVCPTWCCEILSPSSAGWDKVKKRRTYLEIGVKFYWIIDPLNRIIEAYRSENSAWVELGIYTDNDSAMIPPFEKMELNLQSIWVSEG